MDFVHTYVQVVHLYTLVSATAVHEVVDDTQTQRCLGVTIEHVNEQPSDGVSYGDRAVVGGHAEELAHSLRCRYQTGDPRVSTRHGWAIAVLLAEREGR